MTRFFRFAALAAILSVSVSASAQRASGERAERHLERLTERLDLSDSQVAMVKASMSSERTPGASWDLAARLAPTLSASQLETLKAPRKRGSRSDRAASGDRQDREASGDRAARREAQTAERQARRAQMSDARAQALGLTDAQKRALETARTERQRPGAEVLTDEQEAVMLVHRALAPRGARRGGRHGRR